MIDILIGGAILGAIFSLIAAGLNLQYGVTRILNIAHGEFLMIGAYITYVCFSFYFINPLFSLPISGAVVFLLGVLIQLLVFRRLVHLSKTGEELEFRSLLASFGLMFILQNVALLIFGATPLGYSWFNIPFIIFGYFFPFNRIIMAVAGMIIITGFYLFLRFTRFGLAMRATVEEPTGAQLVGININRMHALSFGLGVCLAALAGSLLSLAYRAGPFMGPAYTFIALVIIILGGLGSFVGSIVGGFVLGYVYYFTLTVDALLAMPVVYIFLIIILLIRPKGLLGR
ncbi:MAG: branched-chain amino acid ABC transporter permease [Candidatus Odinarchaeota archaeon]